MSGLNILVVGASVAGPMAAYWLAKAGANVAVLERYDHLRENGQSIDIRMSGVTIMQRMPGMEEAVRAKGTKEEGVAFLRDDGKPYAVMKATGDVHQQALTSEFEIFRGDLARILYDMTKDHPRIKYMFGDHIASMQQSHGGPVRVEFANGLPTAEYDLILACDGATSRTRAMAFECGVRDHIKPVNSWASYFTVDEDFLQGSKIAQVWSTVGGRCFGFRPDSRGVSRAMIMGVGPYDGTDSATVEFRKASKEGDAALKKYIADNFRRAGWKSDALVDGMLKATDFYASEVVQVKVPALSKGRVVLVGDAGYSPSPFSGAGTTLAMTGAYLLAGELATHKGDLPAGLKAYEDGMRPIIDELQRLVPGITTIMAPQTAWGVWIRNTIVGFIVWSGILSLLGNLFGGSLSNNDFGIPEYKFEEDG